MATDRKTTSKKPKRISLPPIPITADAVFKFVFGSPGSEEILASLLNALLAADIDKPFGNITFIPQGYPALTQRARASVMDIVAMDGAGRIVDVEMQRYHDTDYTERLTVYVSHLISYYTPKGKEIKIQKVICLSISEYPLPGMEGCDAPVVRLRTMADQPGYELKGDLPLTVHVNLAQIRRRCTQKKVKDFDGWEKWCYYIAMGGDAMVTDEELEKVRDIVASDPVVQKAHKRYMKALSGDDQDLALALLIQWNQEMRWAGAFATAKVDGEKEGLEKGLKQGLNQGLQQGLQQGLEQGLQQGVQQGIEQGLDQGLQQGLEQGLAQGVEQATLKMAQALKEKGLDLTLIAECTGMDRQVIEAL